MSTTFQQINNIVQKAVSEAKSFVDENSIDFSERDLSKHLSYLENNLVNLDYSEYLRNLFSTVFTECIECWIQLESEVDEFPDD